MWLPSYSRPHAVPRGRGAIEQMILEEQWDPSQRAGHSGEYGRWLRSAVARSRGGSAELTRRALQVSGACEKGREVD